MVQEYPLKEQLNRALLAMLGDGELVRRWWVSPNRHWGGTTPDQVWRVDPLEVKQYIINQLEK